MWRWPSIAPPFTGAHVADNIDEVMGDFVQRFAKGIQLNFDASNANQNAANKTSDAAQNIKDTADKLNMERNALAAIARHLEERDQRSKWDWVTLGCAMLVAAMLAGGAAYYYAQTTIRANDFQRSINLIKNDDTAEWRDIAKGQNIQGSDESWFCAVQMRQFQEEEPAAELATIFLTKDLGQVICSPM